jgi:hypothetical protein
MNHQEFLAAFLQKRSGFLLNSKQDKRFFFEKKKQKTFINLRLCQ